MDLYLSSQANSSIPHIIEFQSAEPEGFFLASEILTFLSILGSSFTLCTFIWLKATRDNLFCYLVMNIAIADLFTAIAGTFYVTGTVTTTLCILTALFRDFGIFCSYFFTSLIAYIIYYAAKQEIEMDRVKQNVYRIIKYGYVIAFILTWLPYFTGSYYSFCTGGFGCWVQSGVSWDLLWFLGEFSLPSIFVFAFCMIMFCKTKNVIEDQNRFALVPNKSYKVLFALPCIFLLCNLPGTVFSLSCFSEAGS
jgi:hypothetical protein